MAADTVDREARRNLAVAVVEGDPALKDLADHRGHVLDLEGHAQDRVGTCSGPSHRPSPLSCRW